MSNLTPQSPDAYSIHQVLRFKLDTSLNAIANLLNERPRRILGYRTPREVFAKLLADEQLQSSPA